MELKIFYLHYNTKSALPKERPDWFSYEKCLKSLIASLRGSEKFVTIKLCLVFDGSKDSFTKDFSSNYFKIGEPHCIHGVERSVHFISAGDAPEASRQLLDYIFKDLSHQDNDLIYILENDYLHTPGWVEKVLDMARSPIPFDYLTLYDHADKYQYAHSYNGKYDSLTSKIYLCNDTYWRSTPSTCFSFLSTAKVLESDKYFFKKLKDRLIQPFLRLTKGRVLLSVLPGLSTHCMTRYLSPTIDWKYFADQAEGYQD